MCKDFEWRESLETGDEIDCADTIKIWYNSTITDTIVINDVKKVHVGTHLLSTVLS